MLDFDLTELGNLLDFPGVSDAVRGAIIDSIGSMMVLPEKYIMKLSPDVDISLLRFPLPKVCLLSGSVLPREIYQSLKLLFIFSELFHFHLRFNFENFPSFNVHGFVFNLGSLLHINRHACNVLSVHDHIQ